MEQQKLKKSVISLIDSAYSTCQLFGSLYQLIGGRALVEYISYIPAKIKNQELIFTSELIKNSMTLFAYMLARFHCTAEIRKVNNLLQLLPCRKGFRERNGYKLTTSL
jgi:hypothetical protein